MDSCKLTLSGWRLHCCVWSRSTLPCVLNWIGTYKSHNPAIPSRNLLFLIVSGLLFPGNFLLASFIDHGAPCMEEMKLPWGGWQSLSLCGQEQSGLLGWPERKGEMLQFAHHSCKRQCFFLISPCSICLSPSALQTLRKALEAPEKVTHIFSFSWFPTGAQQLTER